MLTHIDKNNLPTMVDVSSKDHSIRTAKAKSTVLLPRVFLNYIHGNELHLKKGPVIQTAIIAGTMAVKKTHEIIPFCHQIPLESVKFEIEIDGLKVHISCEVKTTYKTGVEMEALHGAMSAALCIYDMCKALSHEIQILDTHLLSKTGGKKIKLEGSLKGLVLTGGKSERMGQDKALLEYHGIPHAQYLYELLKLFCDEVYLSAKTDQWKGSVLEHLPTIGDELDIKGPLNGILSAMQSYPEANWLVVACDLPFINESMVQLLMNGIDLSKAVTCYKNTEKGFPEPLFAFYRKGSKRDLLEGFKSGATCPVKILKSMDTKLLDAEDKIDLANANTKDEFIRATHVLS